MSRQRSPSFLRLVGHGSLGGHRAGVLPRRHPPLLQLPARHRRRHAGDLRDTPAPFRTTNTLSSSRPSSVWPPVPAFRATSTNRASTPGWAWKALGFADSAWKEGPAPLGYGDRVATLVGYGPNASSRYVTTYFRHTFEATHGYESLVLRLRRDDGAVVYVNGTEVARTNMPAGTITSTTLASSAVAMPDELTYLTFPMTAPLYDGPNVIAVELHQSSRSSSDLVFALALEGTGDTGPLPPPPPPPIAAVVPVSVDAHVRDGSFATTNYGNAADLEVRKSVTTGENRAPVILRLDTSGVADPIAARLALWCRNGSTTTATTVQVHPVASTAWNEATLKWSTAPAGDAPRGTWRCRPSPAPGRRST